MPSITTKDGVEIFYKDWGKGQPIVFSHGWPLSADDWDAQMMFFLNHGYRVIAHDRRGHGRSSQTADGHDMDHYADDLAALTAHLDLKNAIHVGHSTGGGEVVHYLARHGESRVAKAAIISAVPPLMVKTPANPNGLPKDVFDGFQAQLAANRSQFYRDVAAGPFYGYNRPGAKPSEAVIENWWRQGMMGGAKAHYDGIVAFSQTDFTEDLKKITVPVLVMHSDDDQIVPYVAAGPLSAKLLKNGTLKTYKGFPHGMPTTEAATINEDLLAFSGNSSPGVARFFRDRRRGRPASKGSKGSPDEQSDIREEFAEFIPCDRSDFSLEALSRMSLTLCGLRLLAVIARSECDEAIEFFFTIWHRFAIARDDEFWTKIASPDKSMDHFSARHPFRPGRAD